MENTFSIYVRFEMKLNELYFIKDVKVIYKYIITYWKKKLYIIDSVLQYIISLQLLTIIENR